MAYYGGVPGRDVVEKRSLGHRANAGVRSFPTQVYPRFPTWNRTTCLTASCRRRPAGLFARPIRRARGSPTRRKVDRNFTTAPTPTTTTRPSTWPPCAWNTISKRPAAAEHHALGRNSQDYLLTSWRATAGQPVHAGRRRPHDLDHRATCRRSGPGQHHPRQPGPSSACMPDRRAGVRNDLSCRHRTQPRDARDPGIAALGGTAWPAANLYDPDPHVAGLAWGPKRRVLARPHRHRRRRLRHRALDERWQAYAGVQASTLSHRLFAAIVSARRPARRFADRRWPARWWPTTAVRATRCSAGTSACCTSRRRTERLRELRHPRNSLRAVRRWN